MCLLIFFLRMGGDTRMYITLLFHGKRVILLFTMKQLVNLFFIYSILLFNLIE
jgi:hypothetical protein